MIKLIMIIVVLLIIIVYISNKFIKNKNQRDIILWYTYLDTTMYSIVSKISMDTLIVNVQSRVNISTSDSEFRIMLIEFTRLLKINLGRLYKDIYLKYMFKNEDQFQDYLTLYLYNYISEIASKSSLVKFDDNEQIKK